MKKISFTRADLAGFGVGLGSLWIQVELIRRLFAAFSGNELTIGIALSMWMVGSGLGALALGRLSDRVKDPARTLAAVFILIALALVPLVLATARIKPWLGIGAGELAGLPAVILSALLVAGPMAALFGFAFNLASRLQRDYETAGGRAYRFESAGAFCAGLILALWFSGRAAPLAPALAVSWILLLIALHLPGRLGLRAGRPAAVVLALALALLGFLLHSRLERDYQRLYWGGRSALDSFDSRYGYLAAVQEGSEVTIYEDGSPAATFPDPMSAERLSHLPLAMVEVPRRVALIGGGLSNLAEQILLHPVERLDYLQLDPGFLELEQRFAPGFDRLVRDERVRVHRADGRAWLKSRPGAYDAIIVNLSDPLTAGRSRFYTAEFMAEARDALAPGGVFAFTIGVTPPNRRLSPGQLGLLAGALKTVDAAFPQRVLFTLSENIVVAGGERARLVSDPEEIERALSSRGIACYYACASMIEPELGADLLPDPEGPALSRTPARADRDLHPRGYLYGIMLYSERASPGVSRALKALLALPLWSLALLPALVLLAGLAGAAGFGTRAEAVAAVFASGFSTMVAVVAMLIAYQVLAGAVFFALSLLSAAFMIGLAGGAWLWERARPRLGLIEVELGLVLGTLVCLAAVFGMSRFSLFGGVALLVSCLALFVQGGSAGAVFAEAARSVIGGGGEVGRGVGWAYGFELLGSALGGLLCAVAVIPVFGILWALALALSAALAAFLVSLVRRVVTRS